MATGSCPCRVISRQTASIFSAILPSHQSHLRTIMANLAYNCSISKQDCAIHNPLYSYNHGFTSSSCVSYRPWYTGDVGICGWAGAPCTIFGNVSSNCSKHVFATSCPQVDTCDIDFPGAAVCVNGSCG